MTPRLNLSWHDRVWPVLACALLALVQTANGSGIESANVKPPEAKPESASAAPSAPMRPGELVSTYRDSLVLVTGAKGAGSGFIATMGGKTYLITNAHVAAEAHGANLKTIEGKMLKAGDPSVAVGHDVFRIEVEAASRPFAVLPSADANAEIGDEIAVLGNAEGAGVVNAIPGKIVGFGPNLVEVDAPFVPGNSGSPIIHLKTGKVIGVATYLIVKKYDDVTRQAFRAPVIRHFGYRLDSVATWQPVNWTSFFSQASDLQNIETLTENLGTFLMDLAKNHHVTPGLHTNPVIKTHIDAWLAARTQRLSPRDAASNDENFLSFLKSVCQQDVTAEKRRATYDYFQRQLAEQQEARNEMSSVFDRIIKELRKAP